MFGNKYQYYIIPCGIHRVICVIQHSLPLQFRILGWLCQPGQASPKFKIVVAMNAKLHISPQWGKRKFLPTQTQYDAKNIATRLVYFCTNPYETHCTFKTRSTFSTSGTSVVTTYGSLSRGFAWKIKDWVTKNGSNLMFGNWFVYSLAVRRSSIQGKGENK